MQLQMGILGLRRLRRPQWYSLIPLAPTLLLLGLQTVQQIVANVAFLRRRSEEMPILLANSQAGTPGPLYNPTAMANGWAPYLVPPNPR